MGQIRTKKLLHNGFQLKITSIIQLYNILNDGLYRNYFVRKITNIFSIKIRCPICIPDNISIGVRVSTIFFRLLDGGRRGTIVGTLTIPAVMIARNLFEKNYGLQSFTIKNKTLKI